MNGGTRQRNLLIVLGVLVLYLVWHFLLGPMLGFGGDEGVTAPTPAARPAAGDEGDEPARPGRAGTRTERHGAKPGDRVEVLRLADLDRIPNASTPGRDPWRFVDPPPKPPAPPPPPHVPTAAELAEAERLRKLAEEQARLAAIEAAKPHPPEFTLQYLGRFGPPDKQIAVFLKGKDTLNVQQGEVIDNKFIVARIGYESVDIRFVGFPDVPPKRVGVTASPQSRRGT